MALLSRCAAATLLLPLAVAAGCGGGDEATATTPAATPPSFVQQAGAICRAVARDGAGLNAELRTVMGQAPDGAARLAAAEPVLRRAAELRADGLRRLAALRPPAADAARVRAYVAAQRDAQRVLERLVAAAAARDAPGFTRAGGALAATAKRTSALGATLRVPGCGAG